jgi:hypothetical protein
VIGRQRRTLLQLVLASAAVFFTGLLLSAITFRPVRDQGWTALIISDLQSPEENPRGYGYSAAATAVSGLLLLPVIASVHRRLWPRGRPGTAVGTLTLAAGASGAIAIGVLAPFPVSYDHVHIPLAFATFIGIVAGTSAYVGVLVCDPRGGTRGQIVSLRACLVVQLALVAFLGYVYFVPDFFDGRTLWTTLAFMEWSLCAGILAMLVLLVSAIER